MKLVTITKDSKEDSVSIGGTIDITDINTNSNSFDFLNDEPDIYKESDLKR